jgi:hypothetical protein
MVPGFDCRDFVRRTASFLVSAVNPTGARKVRRTSQICVAGLPLTCAQGERGLRNINAAMTHATQQHKTAQPMAIHIFFPFRRLSEIADVI